MGPRALQFARGTRLRTIERQHFALHDVGLSLGDLRERLFGDAECLRECLRIVATHPVADAERAMFRIESIVKRQDRVTGRGAKGLDRMAVSPGEIPEIAGTMIDHFGDTLRIDNRNLAVAIDNVSPLG